jgi:hypothetical protein
VLDGTRSPRAVERRAIRNAALRHAGFTPLSRRYKPPPIPSIRRARSAARESRRRDAFARDDLLHGLDQLVAQENAGVSPCPPGSGDHRRDWRSRRVIGTSARRDDGAARRAPASSPPSRTIDLDLLTDGRRARRPAVADRARPAAAPRMFPAFRVASRRPCRPPRGRAMLPAAARAWRSDEGRRGGGEGIRMTCVRRSTSPPRSGLGCALPGGRAGMRQRCFRSTS